MVNLLYGVPSEISSYLIPHPIVRKISFTGSTAVGKHLAAMAGEHMKRVTMELGGHAPAIVFEDADLEVATKILAANKYRNAGQVCVAPTRFLVQQKVYDEFVTRFVAASEAIKVGNGLEQGTTMGPLANERRVHAMDGFIADAVQHGGEVRTGGARIGNKGNFFQPTVLTNVPRDARVMNEEPFGPLAIMMPFHDLEEAVTEANRLPYGLAAYAYTRSAKTRGASGGGGGVWHDVDQPPWPGAAGDAVRRHQGQRLWLRGRHRRAGCLSGHEVRDAGWALAERGRLRVRTGRLGCCPGLPDEQGEGSPPLPFQRTEAGSLEPWAAPPWTRQRSQAFGNYDFPRRSMRISKAPPLTGARGQAPAFPRNPAISACIGRNTRI